MGDDVNSIRRYIGCIANATTRWQHLSVPCTPEPLPQIKFAFIDSMYHYDHSAPFSPVSTHYAHAQREHSGCARITQPEGMFTERRVYIIVAVITSARVI